MSSHPPALGEAPRPWETPLTGFPRESGDTEPKARFGGSKIVPPLGIWQSSCKQHSDPSCRQRGAPAPRPRMVNPLQKISPREQSAARDLPRIPSVALHWSPGQNEATPSSAPATAKESHATSRKLNFTPRTLRGARCLLTVILKLGSPTESSGESHLHLKSSAAISKEKVQSHPRGCLALFCRNAEHQIINL